MFNRKRRGTRLFLTGLVGALAVASLGLSTTPAQAQKVNHTDRYQSVDQPIATQSNDPNCTQYAGVYRWSKVWADTYGVDESWKTEFRMQFHTTYSPAVAAAKFQYQLTKTPVKCQDLNNFKGVGIPVALLWSSCGASNKPARWCAVAGQHPNSQVANLGLTDRCADLPGGPYPAARHEWHNLSEAGTNSEANLYNVDVLAELGRDLKRVADAFGISFHIPVFIDDATILAGVSNFNQSSASNTDGSWLGYGHVQTAAASELFVQWYDEAARRLGKNPWAKPIESYNAVDNAIAAGRSPKGLNNWTRAQLYDVVCAYTPKIADVVDPNRGASMAATGQDLSGWVLRETGKTLCNKVKEIPRFASVAPFLCVNAFVGMFFSVVDNNNCMNRPTDAIANALGLDLGCNRRVHLMRLFKQMKAFLGG